VIPAVCSGHAAPAPVPPSELRSTAPCSSERPAAPKFARRGSALRLALPRPRWLGSLPARGAPASGVRRCPNRVRRPCLDRWSTCLPRFLNRRASNLAQPALRKTLACQKKNAPDNGRVWGVLAGSGAGDRSRDNVGIAESPDVGWLAVSRLSSATEHGSWTSDSRTALLDVVNQDRLFNRRKGPRLASSPAPPTAVGRSFNVALGRSNAMPRSHPRGEQALDKPRSGNRVRQNEDKVVPVLIDSNSGMK
jgi:hypothetical protein